MKNTIKDKIRYFGWEDIWCGFTLIMACALMYVIGCAIFADKTPQGYYLSSIPTNAGIAYRIKTIVPFMEDPIAFTTPDYKVALSVLDKLQK